MAASASSADAALFARGAGRRYNDQVIDPGSSEGRRAKTQTMNADDEAYLNQFRELAAKKKEIAAMIAGLEKICAGLKTWQTTASHVSTLASDSRFPEWSAENLKELTTLRSLLVEYHQRAEQLRRIWDKLTVDQRTGFAGPETLVEKT